MRLQTAEVFDGTGFRAVDSDALAQLPMSFDCDDIRRSGQKVLARLAKACHSSFNGCRVSVARQMAVITSDTARVVYSYSEVNSVDSALAALGGVVSLSLGCIGPEVWPSPQPRPYRYGPRLKASALRGSGQYHWSNGRYRLK